MMAKEGNNKIKVTLTDKGRWFLFDAISASAGFVLPTPTAIDNGELVGHIEQQGQMADDAQVPTHLWSSFFRESFIHYFGSVSGVSVELGTGHIVNENY